MKAGEKLCENGKSSRRERGEPPLDPEKERMSVSLQSREIYMCSLTKPRILGRTLGR